jgi:hypothetical protein
VALACAAAFQAIHLQNRSEPDSIRSVALPGLGASTGGVPASTCANLMWTGYHLFADYQFRDFPAMRAALDEQLAELEINSGTSPMRIQLPLDNDWVR